MHISANARADACGCPCRCGRTLAKDHCECQKPPKNGRAERCSHDPLSIGGIPDIPPQRITDLETAIRQLRQLSCILDSCTIAASYEVSQAQKALLLMPRTARVASTSSGELNTQVSLPTDDEYHAPHNQTSSKNTSAVEAREHHTSHKKVISKN